MRRAASSFVFLAAAGLLAGCPDRSISELNPEQGRVEGKTLPVKINRDLDLLFLIDDSPSMSDKQINLADNFPRFIEVLKTIPGGLPNIHIAVVTSDYGTKGAEDLTPGPAFRSGIGACKDLGQNAKMLMPSGITVMDKFLSDIQDPAFPSDPTKRIRNYDPSFSLEDAFAKMAKVGAAGCGFEQHLEAIKQALQPSKAENAGFLRPDAFLAVIIIADEDDCSMKHSSLLSETAGDILALGQPISFRCTRFGVLCSQGGNTPDAMNEIGGKNQCRPNDGSQYLTKVADYATFLKNLKPPGHADKVVVAGIMGTFDRVVVEDRIIQGAAAESTKYPQLAHSCSYTDRKGKTEVADPPIRIKSFLDQFSGRSTFSSICQQDLSGGLRQIGELLRAVIGDPCIEGRLADVDPATPGTQFDCSVSQTSPNLATKILPQCPATVTDSDKPCWHIDLDPAQCCDNDPAHPEKERCMERDPFILKIERTEADLQGLPNDTNVNASCVTEVGN
jgi:hypothetical protein